MEVWFSKAPVGPQKRTAWLDVYYEWVLFFTDQPANFNVLNLLIFQKIKMNQPHKTCLHW